MIRVGTDCSGIEAPIQALKNIGIEYEHIFSCDNDKNVLKSIIANYKPETIYEDINEERELKDIDLYVCGFPCQPFSSVGKKRGIEDERSQIYKRCLDVIKRKKPKVFIFENVRNLKNQKDIMEEIYKLESEYSIYKKILNTKDYGIPQNRERLYIVGLLGDIKFDFPENIECRKIEEFVDEEDKRYKKYTPFLIKKEELMNKKVFCNPSVYRKNPKNTNRELASAITTKGYMCSYKHRDANVKELLKLQGFPEDFKQVVSDTQMKKQIGNSMSVNVLEHLIKNIYETGIFKK